MLSGSDHFRDGAIGLLGVENFTDLDVTSESGWVKVGGIADRKSTRDHAINIASRVPGVLEVSDELQWQWDDTALTPVRNRADPNVLGSYPGGGRAAGERGGGMSMPPCASQ